MKVFFKVFFKVLLSILLIGITFVNIMMFIYIQNIGSEKADQLIANSAIMKNIEWYKEHATFEERQLHLDKDKYNDYSVDSVDEYIKNIDVTHIYNTNVTYYDDKNKKTEIQEKTTYNLNGDIWCNRLFFPYKASNWKELTSKYYDESKYGNGNILSFGNMNYYEPLITYSIYSSGSDTYFPLELLQKSHDEKRQIIQTYNGVDYDVSNNDYKWSHWEHGNIAYSATKDLATNTLTEAIFTFDDGTSNTLTITDNSYSKLEEEFGKIDLYNLSKIELHFNSTVNYSEKQYREGFAKACARFTS